MVLLLAGFVLLVYRSLLYAWHNPLTLRFDDTFYYLITAQNIVDTGVSTFDGVNPTNGYHPLWMLVHVVVLGVGELWADLTAHRGLVLMAAVEGLVFLVSVGFIGWIVFRLERGGQATVAVALLVGLAFLGYPRHSALFLSGMESILLLPTLAGFLAALLTRRYWLAGVAAVLLTAARVDTIVYIVGPAALLVVLYERPSWRHAVATLAKVYALPTLFVLAFMGYNAIVFGHAKPISGMSKSTFPIVNFQPQQLLYTLELTWQSGNWHGLLLRGVSPITGLALAVIGGLALLRPVHLTRRQTAAGLLLAILAMLQVASWVLFRKWSKPVEAWYYAPLVVLTAGVFGLAVVNWLGRRRTVVMANVGLVVMVAAIAVREGRNILRGVPEVPPAEYHVFMAEQPDEMRFATTDAGGMAFTSEQPVVNLDGLINGFELQEAIRSGRLHDYLRTQDVRYLVVPLWSQPQLYDEPVYRHRIDESAFRGTYDVYEYRLYSHIHGTFSEPLRLTPEDEVFRERAAGRDTLAGSRVVIWDLQAVLNRDGAPSEAVATAHGQR